MSTLLLFVLPCLSASLLYDAEYAATTLATAPGKSPCDDLGRQDCTAKLGCAWGDNACYPHIAWLHVMKCGSSFGTTLAHYANGALPEGAHIPSGRNQSDPEDTTREGLQGEPNFFRFKYPVNKWFKDVFRNPRNPGNHLPILEEEWDEWRNNWFGIFREPASRTLSSYNHFGDAQGDMLEFARKIAGQQASMLSAGAAGFAKIRCEFNQTDAPEECRKMVEPDVLLAIQRLDGFAFVGIIEEFEVSVCLFHVMLGSDCMDVEFLNTRKASYHEGEAKKKQQLELLERQGDPWDGPVYDAAKRRFWGDVRKYGVTPSVCRKLCPSSAFKADVNGTDSFNIPHGY